MQGSAKDKFDSFGIQEGQEIYLDQYTHIYAQAWSQHEMKDAKFLWNQDLFQIYENDSKKDSTNIWGWWVMI